MPFKLKNKYEMFGYDKNYSNGDRLVVEKKLPKEVYGQINPNGVIEINKDLSPKNKKRAVAHEQVHLDQMNKGLLKYDSQNYYYRKNISSPIQVIPASEINTHDRDLPWEKHSK
tara:strand:+ start:295 stop:636 length:342 start_codon:yes stop_codon:yes gene_type:complete